MNNVSRYARGSCWWRWLYVVFRMISNMRCTERLCTSFPHSSMPLRHQYLGCSAKHSEIDKLKQSLYTNVPALHIIEIFRKTMCKHYRLPSLRIPRNVHHSIIVILLTSNGDNCLENRHHYEKIIVTVAQIV